MGDEKPACRLVAVDGNGTLLGADGSVSEDTRSVIQRLEAKGIPVVLATARPFEKAKATLASAGMGHYALTENGARAVRISDGSAVWERWLEGHLVAGVLRRVKEHWPGAHLAQLTSCGGLLEEGHPWLKEPDSKEAAEKIFRTKVPDVVEELAKGGSCAKTYVHLPEAADFPAAMQELQGLLGDGWELREIKQLLPKTFNTCEVQSCLVNKAEGLAQLCQVWAFGDDANDRRMLSEVGWGVRMANHLPALGGIGKDVTELTNEEDGVAKYLEKHLLNGEPVS
ncbi:unnamed protein product [Effrenium voratum]|uniref:Haloacid dehalogenase-like hydrolase n=1 Tax=Effrenium voratum TaxID=2562239 RepID=A0AA36IRB0_9DINO|nr:unnamed protein product [Effrenium voratum]CAJ1419153.1 unnamed protein product [Effrenium voratum]